MRKPRLLFAIFAALSIVYGIASVGKPAKVDPSFELKYTVGQVTDAEIEYDGLDRRYLYYNPEEKQSRGEACAYSHPPRIQPACGSDRGGV